MSAGNDGPACSSIWPPATAAAAFTVGASDTDGNVAEFSSRGPILIDGSGRIKPDVVAPGTTGVDPEQGLAPGIPSAIPNGRYARFEGTSMAAPHVSGLVALLWSADPRLIGEVELTEQIISSSAVQIVSQVACDGNRTGKNNLSGSGLINAYQAVQRALETP